MKVRSRETRGQAARSSIEKALMLVRSAGKVFGGPLITITNEVRAVNTCCSMFHEDEVVIGWGGALD